MKSASPFCLLTLLKFAQAFCFTVIFVATAGLPIYAEQASVDQTNQKMLKQEAANALWRLRRALKEHGFYSGRIALNVWRSTAQDAGTFDQEQFDTFKKQLYQKSIENSLRCFEDALLDGSHNDARICLQTWKVHASEIDAYDENIYAEMQQRLEQAKNNPPPISENNPEP
jgi:hypothetical protein